MDTQEYYKEFIAENPDASQEKQGEFFTKLINEGIKQADIVLAVEKLNEISHGAAKKRVSSCMSIYRKTSGGEGSGSTEKVADTAPMNTAGNEVGALEKSETVAPQAEADTDNAVAQPEEPIEKVVENRPYEDVLPSDFVAGIPLDKLVAAPKEWNFFEPPNDEAWWNIVKTVHRYGLWNPITVWEQEDGTYMILGGHTRKRAFEYLYEETKDDRYLTIPATVYQKDTLDEDNARRIIILNNTAQRNRVPEKLRPRCFAELVELEKKKAFYGSGIDVKAAVAKASGTSRTTVFNYVNLKDLVPELLNLFGSGDLSMGNALILRTLPESFQKHVCENGYYERPAKQLRAIKKAESVDDIDSILQNTEASPESHSYAVKTTVEKPEGFSTIGIHVASKDLDKVKELLRDALERAEEISSDTKQVAIQMLG